MHLNPTFISNIQSIYGDAGKDWIKNLLTQINTLADQWHFELIHPLSNLSYNFVGLVRMKSNNTTAILKIALENSRLATEIQWLNCMTHSVPKVYAYEHNAYLMEHLVPGKSLITLVQTGKDNLATQIICKTIINLQTQQNLNSNLEFKHLSELAKSLTVLDGIYNKKLLDQAKSLFHDLTIDRSQDIILHGDLHHDNIISSESDWKVIDPHGYIGDPVAEVGAMVRNLWGCFTTEHALSKIIQQRLDIMKSELPFDPQKIKAWAFCITVLSAAWTVEDHPNAKATDLDMEVAEAILKAKM